MKKISLIAGFLLLTFGILGCGIGEQSNVIIGSIGGSAALHTCDIDVVMYTTNTVGGKITEWKIELLTYDSVVATITPKNINAYFPIT